MLLLLMIITIGGRGGGIGRTTIATNLAIMRSSMGHKVLLVDAAINQTASDFTLARNKESGVQRSSCTSIKRTGSTLGADIQLLQSEYDDILVDTGGCDTSQLAALSVSNFLLVPLLPYVVTMQMLEKIMRLIREVKVENPSLNAVAFLNRVEPFDLHSEGTTLIMKLLQNSQDLSFIPISIGKRTAFLRANVEALAVTELEPPDPTAIEELSHLYAFVFNEWVGDFASIITSDNIM